MSTTLRAPDVFAQGRRWSGEEVDAIARGWRAAVREHLAGDERPIAVALPSTPEGVALLAAVTSLPPAVILLHPDVRAWRSEPAIPAGTPLILPPALAHLAAGGDKLGLVPHVLPEASTCAPGPPVDMFSGGGIVQFTSGSTGPPKPVFFPMPTFLAGPRNRVRSMGLEPGAGIAMSASPAYGQGLLYLATAVLLGGPLALLDPHDHRQALVTLAEPVLGCWRATRHFLEALTTCILTGPAVMPRLCVVGTPLPPTLHDAFGERFGVPLRQGYSSTETGPICLDVAPPERVQRDTVGTPLDGVEVRVGDDPTRPFGPERVGRIWVRSASRMAGYGFPACLERPGDVDGWWPTQDLGTLRADGYLVLAGRMDDAIRTRDNRTINLAHVAASLRQLAGARDAVVVPLDGTHGRSFGAVVECDEGVTAAILRAGLASVLPPWAWPSGIEPVPVLPRLPNGKPDRQACARLLAARMAP